MSKKYTIHLTGGVSRYNKVLKIISIITFVLMLFSFVSCGDTPAGNGNGNGNGTGGNGSSTSGSGGGETGGAGGGTGGGSGGGSTPASTYTVTYVDGVNDAVITVPSDTTQYHTGDTVTVSFTGIGSRTNYTFSGWSDGTTTYTSSGTTSFTMGTTNVTLTAQWQWNYSYIGTKASSEAKEVGDIVFNDGSAMPYTTFNTLDTAAKNEKKTSAIALIFYKGTGLNNNNGNGTPNTTTTRTLGVGLKHGENKKWCTSSAKAKNVDITTIQCTLSMITGVQTLSGNENGSDNLDQIAAFLAEADGVTDDTTGEGAADRYPAFYFCKNYKNQDGSHVSGTSYETGWYLPSMMELYQIYVNGKGANKVFDIDAASSVLGGNQFGTSYYWSSSECSVNIDETNTGWTCGFGQYQFSNPSKTNHASVCAIREF